MKKYFSETINSQPNYNIKIKPRDYICDEFKACIINCAKDASLTWKVIREAVCTAMDRNPDEKNNWSDQNIEKEVRKILFNDYYYYDWSKIYDIYQRLHNAINEVNKVQAIRYRDRVNDVLKLNRYQYYMNDSGDIELINPMLQSEYNEISNRTCNVLDKLNLKNSEFQLREAISCLSKMPEPNMVGSICHAINALESFLREKTKKGNPTLGQILIKLKNAENNDPGSKVIYEGLDKIWGYSSNYARHGSENKTPILEDAQFVVGLVVVLIPYLDKKLSNSKPK